MFRGVEQVNAAVTFALIVSNFPRIQSIAAKAA